MVICDFVRDMLLIVFNNMSRTKVHTKGRRRGEFKNWKA